MSLDRIPWAPNLAYWWDTAPQYAVDLTEPGFYRAIGGDALIRGHYPMTDRKWEHLLLFSVEYADCEVTETVRGNEMMITYRTPAGVISARYIYSESGHTWFLRDHPVRSAEDFNILARLYEFMRLTPNYTRWKESVDWCGEEALIVPLLVPDTKSAFQAMIEYWVGTEELVYLLADQQETVEHTLAIMGQRNLEAVTISAASGAEVFTTWEDTSTTNISPGTISGTSDLK